MANMHRELTASFRSEDATYSAGSRLIPALGLGPHLSTSDQAACQESNHSALPICKAMISCVADAVDTSYALHTTTLKGSTVSLIHGNLADKKLFTVSP
jgi:hypothetical protein